MIAIDYEHVVCPVSIEIVKRPGIGSWRTNFTVGWADVKDAAGNPLGSVEAKLSGSVEIHIRGEGEEGDWILRLRVPELWRLAQEAIHRAQGDCDDADCCPHLEAP